MKNNIADIREIKRSPSIIVSKSNDPDYPIKVSNSASDQRTYLSYVCLVNDIKPCSSHQDDSKERSSYQLYPGSDNEPLIDHEPIRVERTKALHELIECHKRMELLENDMDNSTCATSISGHATNLSDSYTHLCKNPRILKLTRMNWLSDGQDGGVDSSTSLSPISSGTCSTSSSNSQQNSIGEKCLSTILQLDKEHNLFGLSNITIVPSVKPSKKIKKDEKPAFPQTAIVQVCCESSCCRHRSKTSLPESIKCGGGCRQCCTRPSYAEETLPFKPPDPPCGYAPPAGPKRKGCVCSSARGCAPPRCMECPPDYGFSITLKKKPKYPTSAITLKKKPKYPTSAIEVTPRSSCILQLPMAARTCHHVPHCMPPSNCFPFLMPCYWPARPSAPCNTPGRCFHNPPCLQPRKRSTAPAPATSSNAKKDEKEPPPLCGIESCPGAKKRRHSGSKNKPKQAPNKPAEKPNQNAPKPSPK